MSDDNKLDNTDSTDEELDVTDSSNSVGGGSSGSNDSNSSKDSNSDDTSVTETLYNNRGRIGVVVTVSLLLLFGGLLVSDQLLETDEQTPVDRPAVVEGAVTLQDTPVENAEVMVFYSSESAEATTQTNENGEYAFTTIDEQEVTKVVVNVTGSSVSGYEHSFYATSQKQVDASSTPITKDFNFVNDFEYTVNQSQVVVSQRVEDNQGSVGYVGNMYTLQAINNETRSQTDQNTYGQYQQTNDIDGSATESWNSGAGFVPIGDDAGQGVRNQEPFTASYNGNGYEVSNLYINRPSEPYVGLFGDVEGTQDEQKLNNVSVTDSEIVGGQTVGAVVAHTSFGVYENLNVSDTSIVGVDSVGVISGNHVDGQLTSSYATGNSVEATDEYGNVGGFVGVNGGSITESFSTTTVVSGAISGGFSGGNSGTITNSYVLDSEVSGNDGFSGGFVGVNSNFGEISKVFAVTTINGAESSGGVAGRLYGGSISDAYYTTSSVSEGIGQINSENDIDSPSQNNITSVTRSELTENPEANLSALDYNEVWVSNGSIPTLQTFIEQQETQTESEE